MSQKTLGKTTEANGVSPAASGNADTMKSTAAAPSVHGKTLRGLMSTSTSRSFEGRFGRMFCLPAATYGDTDAKSWDALRELGLAMRADPDDAKDGFDAEESGIPALYTYFGQFIDHDITFDPVSSLLKHRDPDAITDFRNPALDLDNMYGRGPDDQPYMYNGKKFILGNRLDNGEPDLLRNQADPARAIIGDPRNDENSIVSQFQAVMLRFHNHVVDDDKVDLKFSSLQRTVRWHYQYVVVNDFLPRIICSTVLDGLKTDGRFDKDKIKFYKWKNNPFMPVEFSVAAYRLGHSMVRPGYRLNDDDDTLKPIFSSKLLATGAVDPLAGLAGFQAMAKNRGIDWGRFINIGDPRADGEDPADFPPPKTTPDMKKRLQFAYRLDTSLVNPLSALPPSVAENEPRSLAERNLRRGFQLGLPSGQQVARAMGVKALTDEEILIGKATDERDEIKGTIASVAKLEPFRNNNCPLWTYILAEAMQHSVKVPVPVKPPKETNTPQLGPVGGRIVAEVLLGLLFADKDSFLSCDPAWIPTIGSAGKDFSLRDLVIYGLAAKKD